MALVDLSHEPTGWQKWLLRAPSYLYRAVSYTHLTLPTKIV